MNDYVISLLARVIRLFEENLRLKKELSSRRHQADTWRKKFAKLRTLIKNTMTEEDLKALEEIHGEKIFEEGNKDG